MSCFDAAVPGTGPLGFGNAPSLDFEKFNGSYNLSLRSKSDLNLNPQPEGVIKSTFADLPVSRDNAYVIDTDRGELYPTIETQINVTGQQQFQNRLQDTVRPTSKETTIYSYDGSVAPVTKSQALYTQYIPQYTNIGNKSVRIGGSSNYGLRSATDHSYFAGAGTTAINNNVLQNPDVVVSNLWKRPDFNVDGPGTFKEARPDGTKYQNYRLITTPTTNGLKLNYNLETQNSDLHSYSQMLGKKVEGIENRYTASYQIAPLLTNPLHVIWDPENKGEIPAFYCNTSPQDYSYSNMKKLPEDEYIKGGYNGIWAMDNSKDNTNAYILGLENGIHNNKLEWVQGHNDRPGVVYDPNIPVPGLCYSGARSIQDLYQNNATEISRAYPYTDNTYTTLGDPSAGFIKQTA
jgi:hypothetical protein